MTTRKEFRARCAAPFALAAALAGVVFGGAGCATLGPLHVYTIAPGQPALVHDTSNDAPAANVPDFLAAGEALTGFAYDPFTDHFFLRLAPGSRIRVVDRPARAIKREFTVAALSTAGGGDLAIRPRDGHVFALEPAGSAVIEFTRYGEFIRQTTLEALPGPVAGVAYDAEHNWLLVLSGGAPAHVSTHGLDGRLLASVALDRTITPASLAYDSEKRECYVPLAGGSAIGIFGEDGRFRRELSLPAAFLDVGPRSFLRMF